MIGISRRVRQLVRLRAGGLKGKRGGVAAGEHAEQLQIGILRNRQLHAAAEVAVARDADADFLGHRDFRSFRRTQKKGFSGMIIA